jgi:CRISPR/Cas system-associated endonuclease Cas1
VKSEDFSKGRKGKREYLNESRTHDLLRDLTELFKSKVTIPRVRMGDRQEIETLIKEEALLLAMYLRNEKQSWKPRITYSI